MCLEHKLEVRNEETGEEETIARPDGEFERYILGRVRLRTDCDGRRMLYHSKVKRVYHSRLVGLMHPNKTRAG
jgi:hypothetical protein